METKNSMSGHFEDKENDELMKALKRIPKKWGVYSDDGGNCVFDESCLFVFSSFYESRNSLNGKRDNQSVINLKSNYYENNFPNRKNNLNKFAASAYNSVPSRCSFHVIPYHIKSNR